jgi:uracil DNA glycosylase superfamily protein
MENLNYDPDTLVTTYRTVIQELYARRGILPCQQMNDFCCEHKADCSRKPPKPGLAFHTGTWPYVGALYGDARVHGTPVRILFVAMERGGKFKPSEELRFPDAQYDFRYSAEEKQNAHMGGVSQLIDALVDNEDLKNSSTLFALTNHVKCVWFTDSQDSESTGTMISNCNEHLRAEIEVLQPHLVVTQGVPPANTIRGLFPSLDSVASFIGDAGTSSVLVGKDFIVLVTPHPTRKKNWKWKTGVLPAFLHDAAERARTEVAALLERSGSV